MASRTLDSAGEITASGIRRESNRKASRKALAGVETDGGFAPATPGFSALRQTDSPPGYLLLPVGMPIYLSHGNRTDADLSPVRRRNNEYRKIPSCCLLYKSDAADEEE